MLITKGKFNGIYIIELKPFIDERGFFMRTYDENIFIENGIVRKWVQENHSKSLKKGIIRGLHFQLPPYSETKLVRCIRGRIQDVFVDLRKNSKTFGKWDSLELSDDNFKCVLIPKGFAHGFCTLTENCEVVYKIDNYYLKEKECGLIWNDVNLNIKWETDDPYISDKDKNNITFEEFILKYKYIIV